MIQTSLFASPALSHNGVIGAVPFVQHSRHGDELYGQGSPHVIAAPGTAAFLSIAENARHEARREYVKARAGIGAANAKGQAATRYSKAVVFTAAQMKARKSAAFSRFNRASAVLRAADRAVADAVRALAV